MVCNMIAKIIVKNNHYYCGFCRMKQALLKESCWFCGHIFTNYEEVAVENYNDRENAIVKFQDERGHENDQNWKSVN